MPEWTTALPDWRERIVARQSLVPCAPLFPAEAAAAMDQFASLRLVDVPGSPAIGDVCRPWVMDFAASIFGAYDAESGRRLIREWFLLVSKKNTKSTIAAAIMLTAMYRNWRLTNEFMIMAPTVEIANNSFIPARDMVRADEELSDLLKIQEHLRTITDKRTNATLRVVAADAETVGGKKAAGILVDELWLFGKRANAENMLREATGGRASRPEGFTIYLSTQSDQPPAGVFAQTLADYRAIRDGELYAPHRMGILYEYPPEMVEDEAYRDPATWYITNPNLGASVDEEFLRDEQTKAERAGLASTAGFYAKHLNVQIGSALRTNRWAGAEYWARRADRALTFDAVIERSDAVVVGIDGGGLDDLFGLAVLGRDRQTKHWLAWVHAWCHRGVLDRRKSIASRLEDFAAAGELTIVDDELGDLDEIVAIIERVKAAGLLAEVGVDPAGLGGLVDALAEVDVTEANKLLVGVGQGFRLMNAIKTAERRLANGTLWHCGSGLMAWCVTNVKIEPTATAVRATKQNAGDAKIDPWAALMNAVDRMSLNPAAPGEIEIAALVA
jgi:phage terminase large subunit-like protein